MSAGVKTAVLGATGYAGVELTRILLHHPRLARPLLLRRDNRTDGAANLADVFPALSGNGSYPFERLNWARLKRQGVQLLFLATPHEISRSLVPGAIPHSLLVIHPIQPRTLNAAT